MAPNSLTDITLLVFISQCCHRFTCPSFLLHFGFCKFQPTTKAHYAKIPINEGRLCGATQMYL